MKNKVSISAVVNTYNEELNIGRCLAALKWADEIIVVDMYSTDKTVELAKTYTDKVFYFENVGYVEPARNFAIDKAKGDWVLVVDADEVVPATLVGKLREISRLSGDISAYYVPEKNILFGQWIKHTGWWPDPHIRFFRKDCVEWSSEIHSVPKILEGQIESLPNIEQYAIEHYPYKKRRDFIHKMNNYTDKEAVKLYESGVAFSSFRAVKAATREFIVRYFKNKGYRDGSNGFVLSVFMAFYYFLAYTKIKDLEV